MPRLAANLSMLFAEHDFLDRFAAAADASFEAVEFLFPYAYPPSQVRARLDRLGLAQALFNLPPGNWESGDRGIAINPRRRSEFQASVGEAIAYAHAIGCPKLHVMAGIVGDGQAISEARQTFVGNLAWAAKQAEAARILLLIEPLNTRDVPGYFLTSLEEARSIIEDVASPALRLQLDLYHRQIMHGDLACAIREFWPIVGHIQISNVPGRHEPDAGEINYPFLLDLIDAQGYDGYVGCEYRPRTTTLAGLGWARRYGIGVKGGAS